MISEEDDGDGDENNGGDFNESRGFENVGCSGGGLHGVLIGW